MSETQIQYQKPEGERLYRYHPETGFTEVTTTQSPESPVAPSATSVAQDVAMQQAMQAQAMQQAMQAQAMQNPVFTAQVAPTATNPIGASVMPPFAPQMPQAPQAQAPLAQAPLAPHFAPVFGAPIAHVPPLSAFGMPSAPAMPAQAAAYHAEHIKQMQEYANAQAAYMAFMAQNGAMLGNTQNAQNAQSAQTAEAQTQSTAFSQERMQEMYQTVTDVVNGKAEPSKVLALFQGISTDFWKGAAIGAAVIALYNYTPLKDVLATSLGTLMAAAGFGAKGEKADDVDLDEDGFEKEEK